MLHHFGTKVSLFCLAFMIGIATPQISLGINHLNINKYQPSFDVTTNHQTDTLLNPTTLDRDEPIYLAQTIICERQLNYYLVLRRVYYPNWGCFDQIVDIRTEKILRSNRAPCNQNC